MNIRRIVCLTEESVEFLYDLGKEKLIVGVSTFVKRPSSAMKLPIISSYIKANTKKIVDLKPDLVVGFSDIQKNIASELIDLGLNVLITNQRSIDEIFQSMKLLASIVGEEKRAFQIIQQYKADLTAINAKYKNRENRPRVYFEEWDEPSISAIRWVSELIDICGGVNVFDELSHSKKASGRIVTALDIQKANPDIYIPCWCGRPFDIKTIKSRNLENLNAVKSNKVFEVDPTIFLQPGPALFKEALPKLESIIQGEYQ